MELSALSVTCTHVFSQSDFDRFAALSGDDNPIHVDPTFAATTRFGRTVAHGMLLYGIISSAIERHLPGLTPVEQALIFPAPTFTDTLMTIRLQAAAAPTADGLVSLTAQMAGPDGVVTCEGETLLSSGAGRDHPKMLDDHLDCSADAFSDYKGLRLGQQAAVERAFTPADLAEYAALTGYHSAPAHAGTTVPGSLLGGLFSYLLGTRLPGRGTNWLKQRLHFARPAYVGEKMTAVVTIQRLRPEKGLVNLETICTNPAGEIVCQGQALVLALDVAEDQIEGDLPMT